MPRLLLVSGLLSFLVAAPAAFAQSFPLGSFIDAIGRAQGAAPAPETFSPEHEPHGKAAPAGRRSGTRAKPVRRPRYEEPADSGRMPSGYYGGNG